MKTVDIVLPRASHGGLEHVVNQTACFLGQQGFQVRVIQIVWLGIEWIDPAIDFCYLAQEADNIQLHEASSLLQAHYEKTYTPNLLIAAEWPAMTPVCRNTLHALGSASILLSWIHNPIDTYERNGAGGMPEMLQADYFLAINTKIQRQLEAHRPGKVFYVRNPIAVEHLPFSDQRDTNEIAFVGRLSKNLELALEAIALLKNTPWILRVVGTGDNEAECRQFCADHDIADKVFFDGWQAHPWERLTHTGLFLSTSDFDGFMLTGAEALWCGIPVVTTPTDGVLDYITPGKNGFFYPFGDAHALAETLEYIRQGVLPLPPATVCHDSVTRFEAASALAAFRDTLTEIFDREGI